jgi:hypothetical protein
VTDDELARVLLKIRYGLGLTTLAADGIVDMLLGDGLEDVKKQQDVSIASKRACFLELRLLIARSITRLVLVTWCRRERPACK